MKKVFFDVETQLSKDQVGGWYPEKMKLALAVTFDEASGFRTWTEQNVDQLLNTLLTFDKVVGFNLLGFDYQVLTAYRPSILTELRPKTVDMLDLIYKQLGFRLKLDDLALRTLNKQKSGDGLQSIQWWAEGKFELVESYCKDDVELTKELYEYGQQNGAIYYSRNWKPARLSCPW